MKKIALVTGAAGGIGQAIVCRLAEEGIEIPFQQIDVHMRS